MAFNVAPNQSTHWFHAVGIDRETGETVEVDTYVDDLDSITDFLREVEAIGGTMIIESTTTPTSAGNWCGTERPARNPFDGRGWFGG